LPKRSTKRKTYARRSATAQRKALEQLAADGFFGRQRLLVGQTGKTTGLFIYDTNGHKRLEMMVNEKNEPVIVFHNEKEEPVKTISY
jgi:hypothetical protein